MKTNDYIVTMDDGKKVLVSREVYQAYYRMKWREEWNSRSFYRHTTSLNSNRSSGSGKTYSLEDQLPSDEKTPEEICLSKELLKSLDILSAYERKIITSIYLDGLSETDCADQMHKTRKFVRYHRKQALEKLRNELTKQDF